MTSPKVDVYQTDTDVVVKTQIQDESKEALNVYIDDNAIRLSGKTKRDKFSIPNYAIINIDDIFL